MKIAVRLDDITPDMDWERFLAFKALLDKYHIRPLIGVIPDNRDGNISKESKNAPEDFWQYIRALQKEGWVIAMHGYQHIYTTKKGGMFPLNSFSEFAGVPYKKQAAELLEGKRLLADRGIETDIFMAPAHSYDRNTLKALKAAGFKALTDGFGTNPYIWKELIFYPISFKLSHTFQSKEGYSTMVIHTGTTSKEDLKKYEGYFNHPQAEWISYEEYLVQKPVKRSLLGRIKEFCMAKGKAVIAKAMK